MPEVEPRRTPRVVILQSIVDSLRMSRLSMSLQQGLLRETGGGASLAHDSLGEAWLAIDEAIADVEDRIRRLTEV